VTTFGLAGLALTGCTLPDGVDGDLTGGWATMSQPVSFVPDAGVCHETDYHQPSSTLAEYQPVDCGAPHLAETVYVGQFDGGAADRVTPPSPGSSAWRSVYGECDDRASDYLGGNFRHARLWLGATVPSPEAWEGGSRWFRCDVIAFDGQSQFERSRSGSLRNALDGDSGLRLGCFEVVLDDADDIERMDPVDCDDPHQAEYVGLWQATDNRYPDAADQDSANRVYGGCREQVAAYVDVPVDGDLQFRTGTIADWMDEEDWDNGDRQFRCYLWHGEDITGSLAGAGTSGLPVR
jgi:hypothetical protein